MLREFRGKVIPERSEPAQLVGILFRAHRLTVRAVDADYAQLAGGNGNDAFLFIREPGNSGRDAEQWRARKYCDAVVRLLSGKCRLVARGLQLAAREFR